jgi:hypothetical protein
MPEGFGGFDLYVCEWSPRGWSAPQNLGAAVNTDGDEMYPFIQANGQLFFSSTAHRSTGGLDIYYTSEGYDRQWSAPISIGAPLNSPADDISYTATDPDGASGYIASNRSEKTYDLYAFRSLFPAFNDCPQQEENDYTYLLEEHGEALLDSSTLKLMWEMGDGTIKYGEEIEHTFPATGAYEVRLSVVDTLTSEIEKEVASYILEVTDIEQPYITVSQNLHAGTPATLHAGKTWLSDMEEKKYYWIFGDGTRARGQYTQHQYNAPGTYRIQLGVTGKSLYTGQPLKACACIELTVE